MYKTDTSGVMSRYGMLSGGGMLVGCVFGALPVLLGHANAGNGLAFRRAAADGAVVGEHHSGFVVEYTGGSVYMAVVLAGGVSEELDEFHGGSVYNCV